MDRFWIASGCKNGRKGIAYRYHRKNHQLFFFLQKKTICTRLTWLNVTRKTFFDIPFAFGEAEIFILDLEDYRSGVHPDL
jgi:hypothetical protein